MKQLENPIFGFIAKKLSRVLMLSFKTNSPSEQTISEAC